MISQVLKTRKQPAIIVMIPIHLINETSSLRNKSASMAVNTYPRLSNGYMKLTSRDDMAMSQSTRANAYNIVPIIIYLLVMI